MKRRIIALLMCLCMVFSIVNVCDFTAFAQTGNLISYSGHQQTYADEAAVSDGAVLGVTGESKRLEAITVYKGSALDGLSGDIQTQVHAQSYGDLNWVSAGTSAGTTGQAKRLEAIRIRLTGQIAEKYDVYYSLHCQTIGWTKWVKGIEGNTESGGWCGTKGYAKRVEAIKIVLVPNGQGAPDNSGVYSFYSSSETCSVVYSGHQQTYADLAQVGEGAALGVTGQSKRLEAIKISLTGNLGVSGGITYRTHVQSYGWQDWVSDGQLAGTTGEAKRLEAIEIKLTGDAANYYDIYYHVHSQTFGWMGWAKNGETAGTTGISKRIESIEIRIVPKNFPAPGSTDNAYREKTKIVDTGKMVALTFDDGPGARCGEILDCLEKYGAHATFFVVGSNSRYRSNLLTRMESIGCEIGNHTDAHATLSKLSSADILAQLEGVNSTLRSTVGHNAIVMRPPGGSYNATVQANVNAPIILWSIDTLDWKTRNTQNTVNVVLNQVQDGDIVLMHDIHTQSVDAALILIPELIKRGYTLVTVSELAEAKGVTLENGKVYSRIR